MKKRKQLLLFTLTTSFLLSTTITTYAGTWYNDNKGWKYRNENNQDVTGWILDNGKYYYIGNDGYMLSNCVTPDGYYINGSGELIDGVNSKSNTGDWNVSADVINNVMNVGQELTNELKAAGYSISTELSIIAVMDSKASYNQGDITLTKSGNEYTVDIGVRLNSINQKALKQLLRLTGYTNSEEIYDAIYQSFKGTGSPINYESFVDIAGHQIKAVNNGNSISYIIK